MRDFRKLKVWKKAHELVLDTYGVTAGFPREELYGITAQLRRACVSIPANIAEGCGREGEAELRRFLRIGLEQPMNSNTTSFSRKTFASYLPKTMSESSESW